MKNQTENQNTFDQTSGLAIAKWMAVPTANASGAIKRSLIGGCLLCGGLLHAGFGEVASGFAGMLQETAAVAESTPAKPKAQQPTSPIGKWVQENMEWLSEHYTYLHRNPELSFEEEKTADYLAMLLEKMELQVTRQVGGFGLVGMLENGPGPTVMLRTDLDALPVTEATQLRYASKVKVPDATGVEVGVMHACGHDVHMTNLLGVTRYLAEHKEQWSGTLMVIGQPAEERGAGARAMLEDGLFEKFPKPDFALALHVDASLAAGKVGVREGYTLANVDSVDITMLGKGGHGAEPNNAIDPVVQAAELVMSLQTIVSREVKPTEPAVVTVGSIHGGTKHNIIGDRCHLQLTVRSYSDDVRKHVLEAIQRKANAVAAGARAPEPEFSVSEGTPALYNDDELAGRMRTVFENAIGKDNVVPAEQVMGGEDFSQYGRAGVPILMFRLGTVETSRLDRMKKFGAVPGLHSALFYPDFEQCIPAGIEAMTAGVLELMPAEGAAAKEASEE